MPRLIDAAEIARVVVWSMLLGLLALTLLTMTGCAAVAGSLGLAGAEMVATGLQTVQQYATARVDAVQAEVVETGAKAQMYAGIAAALGTAGALAGRWIDHKVNGRTGTGRTRSA